MNAQRREGKRAPPDPPILADAKGGRRTKIEGKQREPAWDAGLMDEERAARSKDLMKISADQAAFAAQKDAPNGKKTMKAFL